jgi:hypothetical protein
MGMEWGEMGGEMAVETGEEVGGEMAVDVGNGCVSVA